MIDLVLDAELGESKRREYDIDEARKKLLGSCEPKEIHTLVDLTVDGTHVHKNYMEYLETCYDRHYGYVLSPDMIWYTILSELSIHIKNNAEHYRILFTDSLDKKEISVACMDWEELPFIITDELKKVVPTDVDAFLPKFSTSNAESIFAANVAFCDAVSPFYSYSMYMCGYPSARIRGTKEDWIGVATSVAKVAGLLDLVDEEYFSKVVETIDTIIDSLDSPEDHVEFYKDIFTVKRCGSGGQTEVFGWFTNFFMETPRIRYTYNYSTHISEMDFRNLSTKKDYKISTGIFGSTLNENILTPNYGRFLFELEDKDVK